MGWVKVRRYSVCMYANLMFLAQYELEYEETLCTPYQAAARGMCMYVRTCMYACVCTRMCV